MHRLSTEADYNLFEPRKEGHMAATRFPPQKQMLKGSRMYYTFDLLHSMDLGTAPARTDSQGRVREKVPKAQVRWYDLEV